MINNGDMKFSVSGGGGSSFPSNTITVGTGAPAQLKEVQSETARELERIHARTNYLGDLISMVEEKLQPILSPERSEKEAETPSLIVRTPLARSIAVNADRMEQMINKTQDILNRIEL